MIKQLKEHSCSGSLYSTSLTKGNVLTSLIFYLKVKCLNLFLKLDIKKTFGIIFEMKLASQNYFVVKYIYLRKIKTVFIFRPSAQ